MLFAIRLRKREQERNEKVRKREKQLDEKVTKAVDMSNNLFFPAVLLSVDEFLALGALRPFDTACSRGRRVDEHGANQPEL